MSRETIRDILLEVYELTYENINGRDTQERRAIDYTHILDIGVGYSHWSEQWQLQFGGDIHSLLATRPALQQERYNLIQYRFLNGPVMDGDAFNDGTTNFYMLVKLRERPRASAGALRDLVEATIPADFENELTSCLYPRRIAFACARRGFIRTCTGEGQQACRPSADGDKSSGWSEERKRVEYKFLDAIERG
jgi:hypothetical protein